tara:strand:+ start:135 stop:536 length:402 start_codon:yes stop_codon:yes gene_type:complete
MPLTLDFSPSQLNGAGSLIPNYLIAALPQAPYTFTIYHPNIGNGTAYFNIGVLPNSNGNFSGSSTASFSTSSMVNSFSGIPPGGFVGSGYISSMVITSITSSFVLDPTTTINPNELNLSGTGGIYLQISSSDA